MLPPFPHSSLGTTNICLLEASPVLFHALELRTRLCAKTGPAAHIPTWELKPTPTNAPEMLQGHMTGHSQVLPRRAWEPDLVDRQLFEPWGAAIAPHHRTGAVIRGKRRPHEFKRGISEALSHLGTKIGTRVLHTFSPGLCFPENAVLRMNGRSTFKLRRVLRAKETSSAQHRGSRMCPGGFHTKSDAELEIKTKSKPLQGEAEGPSTHIWFPSLAERAGSERRSGAHMQFHK